MVGQGRRDRVLAVAVAVAAHAVFILVFVWGVGRPQTYAEAPVMSVELAGPWPRKPVEVRRPGRKAEPAPVAALPVRPQIPFPAPLSGVVPAPAADPTGDSVQSALRGLVGCEHAALLDLTPEERRRCQDRLAAAGGGRLGGPPTRLDLSLSGVFAVDAEPYLQRKPHNGCKPRAGGDVSVMGEQGAATGLACAWSF